VARSLAQVSYASDKGGNGFSVTFFNSSTNLHSVWDSSMISKYEGTLGGGWQHFATDLINILKANPAYVTLYVCCHRWRHHIGLLCGARR